SAVSRPEQVVYFFRQVLGVPVVCKEILSQRTADWCRCTIRAAPAWPVVPLFARSLSPGMRRSLCASNAARLVPFPHSIFEPTHVARTACPRAACRLRTAGGRTVDNAGADTNLTARRAEPGR